MWNLCLKIHSLLTLKENAICLPFRALWAERTKEAYAFFLVSVSTHSVWILGSTHFSFPYKWQIFLWPRRETLTITMKKENSWYFIAVFLQSHLLLNVRKYQWCLPLHDLSLYRDKHDTVEQHLLRYWMRLNYDRFNCDRENCDGKINNVGLVPSLHVEIYCCCRILWSGREQNLLAVW